MPVVAPALILIAQEARRRYAPVGSTTGASIRDWLRVGGSYYVVNATKVRLTLDTVDASWSEANGNDVDRFLWAARESVVPRSSPSYDGRSISWAAISSYYCSFYMVMGFLRMFGYGYIYLGTDDVATINAVLTGSPGLEAGVYGMTLTLGARPQIELKKQSVRGVHEGFWRYADESLNTLAQELAGTSNVARPFPSQTRASAIMNIEDFRKWLGEAGKVGRTIGWMSGLRNEINYQFRRKVWGPAYRPNAVTVDRLRTDIQAILRGTRETLGQQLRIDPDVKALIERSSVLYRDIAPLCPMPALP